ncbi:hypothetical protein AALT_g4541 [Alternaria alternata]|nr:hypothetical protein AALT_g4541 [Alternaria alternata]
MDKGSLHGPAVNQWSVIVTYTRMGGTEPTWNDYFVYAGADRDPIAVTQSIRSTSSVLILTVGYFLLSIALA